jgi:hypothetical protein
MAVAVVSVVDLAMNTVSADLPDASGTAITVGADGATIAAGGTNGWPGRKFLVKITDDGGADTMTIEAGDYPPAATSGLGALTFAMAASDVFYIVLESARFMKSDGKIKITSTGTGNLIEAFALPRGA